MNSLSESCTSREIKRKYTIKALINRLPRIRPSPSYKRNKINKLHHKKKKITCTSSRFVHCFSPPWRFQFHGDFILGNYLQSKALEGPFWFIFLKVWNVPSLFKSIYYAYGWNMRKYSFHQIAKISFTLFHFIVQQHILWQHTCILVVRLVISKLIFQVRFKLSKNPMKNCKESSLDDLHFMAV